jgi:UDP-N-acetylglucosamine--N-acetylmuramyl-(pentapeptide) pyrophosphoryl-undecaprenol N-acetylglucosamine transferase
MPTTFLFAGGGTGGHLFPAVAIAEELLSLRPDTRCQFLCSTRPLDEQLLSGITLHSAPVRFTPIPARPFGLRPGTLLRFVGGWGGAVRASRHAIRAATPPAVLVAMGGFVAAPAVQAARAQRVPRALINLDAVPGRANRWIAAHCSLVLTAAPLVRSRPSWTAIPPIVRRAARAPLAPAQCRTRLGLDPDLPTLLVTGASQGAGSINSLMQAVVNDGPGALAGWQVIHQTGKDGVEATAQAYARAGIPAVVKPLFDAMGECWGAADLALSRAGAGSVAEAWASATPTIFMPYPYHRDQHQKHNAAPLANAGGALVITDRVDPAANLAGAGRSLADLLGDAPARDRMREALRRLGPADGAARAARALLDLAGG